MSVFPIDDRIIPYHITKAYLEPYQPVVIDEDSATLSEKEKEAITRKNERNARILEQAADLTDKILADIREKMTVEPKPGTNTLTAYVGTEGVGKSELIKNTVQAGKTAIVPDVGAILGQLPVAQEAVKQMNQSLLYRHYENAQYTPEHHREEIEKEVHVFTPLAKAIRDNVMTALLKEGHDVAVEISGNSPSTPDFIASVQATGATVHAVICDAPLCVKQKGAHSSHHGVSQPEAVIEKDHDAFRAHRDGIAQSANVTTFHWREDASEPLQQVDIEEYALAVRRTDIAAAVSGRTPTGKPAEKSFTL